MKKVNLSLLKLLNAWPCSLIFLAASNYSLAATFYVDGATSVVNLNDDAFFSGFSASDPSLPNAFSSNFLVQGNEQKASDPQAITSIPISTSGGAAGFQFFFDAQETANAGSGQNSNRERNIITQLSLYYLTATQQADSIDDAIQRLGVWSFTPGDQININDATNPDGYTSTSKPLGNGADAALTIPFSAFPSGATSLDYIILEATLSDGNNGNDEWVYAEGYDGSSPVQLVTFSNTPSLNTDLAIAGLQLIPEPSTPLLLAFFSMVGFCHRRRHTR